MLVHTVKSSAFMVSSGLLPTDPHEGSNTALLADPLYEKGKPYVQKHTSVSGARVPISHPCTTPSQQELPPYLKMTFPLPFHCPEDSIPKRKMQEKGIRLKAGLGLSIPAQAHSKHMRQRFRQMLSRRAGKAQSLAAAGKFRTPLSESLCSPSSPQPT